MFSSNVSTASTTRQQILSINMWRSTVKKPFKHSTTFYRRKAVLQKKWNANNPSRSVTTVVESSTITTTEIQSVFATSYNVPVQSLIISASDHQEIDDFDDAEVNNDKDDDINSAANDKIEQNSDVDDEEYILTDGQKRDILRNWLISNQISHKATNELLHILSSLYNVKHLPKDARTFLRTPTEKQKEIKTMGNGEYWHNGLKKSLKVALRDIQGDTASVDLSFNMDGLPLYRSSKAEFWPILSRIDNMPKIRPMVIGIYSGVGKPPCNDFLLEFVDELNDCIENGLVVNDCFVKVQINCFICDTPARALVRGKILL